MSGSFVLLEQDGAVASIVLNRPNELNALNYEALVELGDLAERLRMESNRVRLVTVSAAGRAFCAGADLKERRTLNERQVRRNVRKMRDVYTALAGLPQPTIAVIHGFAFGGGLELALACDFRLALRDAVMGFPEVGLGIVPGAGGTQRLTRLIGPSRAKEWILTARKVSARLAFDAGALNGIADNPAELAGLVRSLADELLANAPLAVCKAKAAIDRGSGVDLPTGLDIEADAYEAILPTKDRIEALEAFAAKRKPVFRGE